MLRSWYWPGMTAGIHRKGNNKHEDNTHLNEHGAEAVARLVAEELAVLDTPLKGHVVLP